jgi:hypothetical protein
MQAVSAGSLGHVDIQVMPACECRFSALPVLTHLNVCFAPVFEIRRSGHCAPIFDAGSV